MRRILMITVVTLSVLASSAMLALWVRSIGRVEGIQWNYARLDQNALTHRVGIVRHYGGIAYIALTLNYDRNSGQRHGWHSINHYTLSDSQQRNVGAFWKRRLGFDHVSNTPAKHSYILAAPHLVWALIFAAPGAWVIWRYRRTRLRNRKGLCPSCGYDLRATPERCPECGWTVATS